MSDTQFNMSMNHLKKLSTWEPNLVKSGKAGHLPRGMSHRPYTPSNQPERTHSPCPLTPSPSSQRGSTVCIQVDFVRTLELAGMISRFHKTSLPLWPPLRCHRPRCPSAATLECSAESTILSEPQTAPSCPRSPSQLHHRTCGGQLLPLPLHCTWEHLGTAVFLTESLQTSHVEANLWYFYLDTRSLQK